MNTEINIPLLRKVVEWVEEQEQLHPRDREWDQTYWFAQEQATECGTTYCLAGKIALEAGWEPVFNPMSSQAFLVRKGQTERYARSVAQNQLGIGPYDAEALFMATNTAKQIRETAEQIAGERL